MISADLCESAYCTAGGTGVGKKNVMLTKCNMICFIICSHDILKHKLIY